MLFLLSLLIQSTKCSTVSNMNGNIYEISNPNQTASTSFSTVYSSIHNNCEFFDVYSPPISSRYGDVYWTMMDPVPLPYNITNRFIKKVMAIVGYEQDQVIRINGEDVSVPITWAYNHHYGAFVQSKNTQMIKVMSDNTKDYGAYNHGAKQIWKVIPEDNSKFPNSQFFSEGNGGESRGSFHGYPTNVAQLIYSPTVFRIQPMQIDTRNRNPKYINDSVFHAGILPKRAASPINADYSGLLECPCTTRINKTIVHNYNSQTKGTCSKIIGDFKTCYLQAIRLGGEPVSNNVSKNISSKYYPYGCSFIQNKYGKTTNITFNTYDSTIKCGNNASMYQGYMKPDSITNISLDINIDRHINNVTIKVTGPSNIWFGLAFNATAMHDLPYTIIVNGTGGVFEVKLGDH